MLKQLRSIELYYIPLLISAIPLATFNTGVSNTSPSSVTPDPSNYLLCEEFVFPVIPFVSRTAYCPLNLYPRRYVIYQQITSVSVLSLGELEVYVAVKRGILGS